MIVTSQLEYEDDATAGGPGHGTFRDRLLQGFHTSLPYRPAYINLQSAEGGSIRAARLNFGSDGDGEVRVIDSMSMVVVGMDMSAFDRVIDTLRNENPVYFAWHPTWATVYTGREPPGENEPRT